ncbi:hypothetical protein B7486_46075 [cyanobacterium TDX16]|nr:hypothetical protein B7486_46075 [cyanobacterium TDX16]
MIPTQPLSRQIEKIQTSVEQSFDYTTLDAETRSVVQQHTSEIRILMRRTAQDIINIGQKLIEVKEQLEHGQFRNWLKVEFDWGVWTATKFMQVAEKFESVNFTHLDIAASALYLLAAPSTPSEARTEALERATVGEAITRTSAKEIVTRHKSTAKPKGDKTATFDVPSETMEWEASPTAMPQKVAQPVEVQSAAVVKPSEDKLPGKTTEAPAYYFQVNNRSHDIAPVANSGDYQAKMERQSLIEAGHRICLTDFELQDHKWVGEVVEVKEATVTEIEVIIRISLEPSEDV